ncbi:hypothetical protein O0L34_g7024 [Tuta absoluta]|nr:hypothetical protein O0L34_g7024 [Tuta absoluta]
MHLPTPLRTPSTFMYSMGELYKIHSLSPTTRHRCSDKKAGAVPPSRHPARYTLATVSGKRHIFSFNKPARRRDELTKYWRREPVRQTASGADWRDASVERPPPPPPLRAGPRVSGRGCGNRLRRNTRHENNRNSECTSEARHDAVGVSETRINTRLFTYGVRARSGVAGQAARGNRLQSARCNYLATASTISS